MKKIIGYILTVIALISIGFGIYSLVYEKKDNNEQQIEKKDEDDGVYLKNGESYTDAVKRICLNVIKKDECKKNEVVEENGIYRISVEYNEYYNQCLDVNFATNSYEIGIVPKEGADIPIDPNNPGGK